MFSVVRGVLGLMVKTIGLNGVYAFGCFFGTLEWGINYKRRRRFAVQMESIFGSRDAIEAKGACRRYFMRTRCDKIFLLILDQLPRSRMLERFEMPERRRIDEGLGRGRGVYLAMSHFGAQQIGALLTALSGPRVAGVRDANEGALDRFIRTTFERTLPEFGRMRTLYSGTFPREVYRCFQENYVVGSALDIGRVRDAKLRTADVNIFGGSRPFLTGPLQVALRCGATILQAFVLSKPGFRYHTVVLGPLVGEAVEETPELLKSTLQSYADHLEQFLRTYPCHVSRI